MFLKYKYQIGSSSDNIVEKIKVSNNNPFVERYCKLLNEVKPLKGSWGTMLEMKEVSGWLKEKQITKDDYNFLTRVMFPENLDDEDDEVVNYFKTEEDNKWADELCLGVDGFDSGVRSDTEYSFLVFEGISSTKK